MISRRRGSVIMWCINIHLHTLNLHNKHNESLDIYFKILPVIKKKENNSMLKRITKCLDHRGKIYNAISN